MQRLIHFGLDSAFYSTHIVVVCFVVHGVLGISRGATEPNGLVIYMD